MRQTQQPVLPPDFIPSAQVATALSVYDIYMDMQKSVGPGRGLPPSIVSAVEAAGTVLTEYLSTKTVIPDFDPDSGIPMNPEPVTVPTLED